ncbi:hypothetical protein ZWY2020_039088 [Hordeum vulgare]|nr:hypothetical protein ZWY2020_039088 [Hordeum vulgare]
MRSRGFEASPTPPLTSVGLLRCTPSPVRLRRAVANLQPAGVGLAVIFEDRQMPVLPSLASLMPRTVRGRHKTIAGVDVIRSGIGLSLQRTSARLKVAGKTRVTPASTARVAEFLVCRSLGIVKDGEDVTAKALDAFAERFKDQLPHEVLSVMRKLFKVDDAHAATVEDALIQHGGEGAMDVERMEDIATAIQGSV